MDRRSLARRVKNIYGALDRHGKGNRPDAILFHNGAEPHLDLGFFYVTGLVSGLYEGSTAVAWPTGRLDVTVSPLEESSARREATFRIHVPSRKKRESDIIKELLADAKVIGVHSAELTHSAYQRLHKLLPKRKFVDVSRAVLEARLLKDEAEIEAITRASRIASRVAEKIPQWLRPGVKESQVAAEIAYEGGRLGAQGVSFDTIAAFGPNAAEPHYTELGARLRRGQFALFDFGFRYRRYCSDITRTFFCGSPKRKDKRMYETVREAQAAAFDLMKPGSRGDDINKAAADVIDSTEFKGTFIHGLGHGLGLAVHDGGSLSASSKLELRPGMVLTVEPGVYLRGYGGVRIEDDVLVTPRGHRKLTTATRDLVST